MYQPYATVSSIDEQISQKIGNLEELHPLDFRLAFGLTHEEAADELCLEPQTMRAYTRKNPSRRVRKLAAVIAKKWVSNGRPLVDPELLLRAIINDNAFN